MNKTDLIKKIHRDLRDYSHINVSHENIRHVIEQFIDIITDMRSDDEIKVGALGKFKFNRYEPNHAVVEFWYPYEG